MMINSSRPNTQGDAPDRAGGLGRDTGLAYLIEVINKRPGRPQRSGFQVKNAGVFFVGFFLPSVQGFSLFFIIYIFIWSLWSVW
jgi:hypothetical protein